MIWRLRSETRGQRYETKCSKRMHKRGIRKTAPRPRGKDRFDRARGRATVKWRTDQLMRLLRGDG